ncbi:MAG TPA: hypothetical protein VFT66_15605 [Roseiflexaceae bacterium]|nr:hypothetical protein [Roseiflexaceae bacterium]
MTQEELREALAQFIHDEQWTGWMRYFTNKCERNSDGSLTVPAGYIAALERQMNTSYSELPEAEQDSDRNEADRILAILRPIIVLED